MYLLLLILIVIAALLMCFIVLIQNSKGGGLSSTFASSNQIMGVRKTTDFLEKATWGIAISIVVLSVCSAYFLPSRIEHQGTVMEQNAAKEVKTSPATMQDFTAPAAAETAPNSNDSAK